MKRRALPPPSQQTPVDLSPVNKTPDPDPTPPLILRPTTQATPDHTHRHSQIKDAGRFPHNIIDRCLPNPTQKELLTTLGDNAPIEITGARDDPEAALADLLTALATLGLITDSTTAS